MGGRVYDASGQRRMMYGQDLLRNFLTREDPNDILRNAVTEWDQNNRAQQVQRDREQAAQITQYIESQGLVGDEATKLLQAEIAKNPNLVAHMRSYAPQDTAADKTSRIMDATKLEMIESDPLLARAMAGDPSAKAEVETNAKIGVYRKMGIDDNTITSILTNGASGPSAGKLEERKYQEGIWDYRFGKQQEAIAAREKARQQQQQPGNLVNRDGAFHSAIMNGQRSAAEGDVEGAAMWQREAQLERAWAEARNAQAGKLGRIDYSSTADGFPIFIDNNSEVSSWMPGNGYTIIPSPYNKKNGAFVGVGASKDMKRRQDEYSDMLIQRILGSASEASPGLAAMGGEPLEGNKQPQPTGSHYSIHQ